MRIPTPQRGHLRKTLVKNRRVVVRWFGLGIDFIKIVDQSIFGFSDNERIWDIPNKIFMLIITKVMIHFYISKIIIDQRRSGGLIYAKLFNKLSLRKGTLKSYVWTYLQGVHRMITHRYSFFEFDFFWYILFITFIFKNINILLKFILLSKF